MATCVFCLGCTRYGKLLMCLHSCCAKCARSAPRSGDDRRALVCPRCSQPTQLPSENPDDVMHLPDDITPGDGLGVGGGGGAEALMCGECDDTTVSSVATHCCVTCAALLCELHSRVHPISRGTIGHGIQLMDSQPTTAAAAAAPARDVLTPGRVEARPPLCLVHAFPCQDADAAASNDGRGGEPATSLTAATSLATSSFRAEDPSGTYCITCGCVLCRSCVMEGTHAGTDHELVSLRQAELQQRSELGRLLPDFQGNILPRLSTSSTLFNTAKREFELNVTGVQRSISQAAEDLVKKIREEEKSLLGQLQAFRSEKSRLLDTRAQDMAGVLDKGKRATAFGQALLDNVNGARFLHDATWALDSLYDITAKMPPAACPLTSSGVGDIARKPNDRLTSAGAASLAQSLSSLNPFDDPPPADDNHVFHVSSRGHGDSATSSLSPTGGGNGALGDFSSLTFALSGDQLSLKPLGNPRISFVPCSEESLSKPTLLGVLSRANVDHRQCLLAPHTALRSEDDLYPVGDDIIYTVRIVSADGSPVRGAEDVGLDVKAVLATTETVSQVPCRVCKLAPGGSTTPGGGSEFSVTFQCKEVADILLYAAIDDVQLPGSPAVVKVGRCPFELDRSKSARAIVVQCNGHLATKASDGDTAILGSRSLTSGVHRWRVRVEGLGGSDFMLLGVCRPPMPNSFTAAITSYTSVLGWTNKSQTMIKGTFRTINMEEWRDGDVVQLQIDFDKRSLQLQLCRTGEKSVMTGGIRMDVVPFFYMFSKTHKLQIMPLPTV